MAQQKTRTFLLGRFEAGDRPTDQDFANLFESILFLNNDLSGHNNGLATDNTSVAGSFEIGGTLNLTGDFIMSAQLSVGNTAEALQSPISAYNSDNFAVYYASSSLSDTMFEGYSQDVTSSIKLTETLAGSTPAVPSTNTLIFGTSAGRAFLQNDGQEILHMTSSGHNGSSPQVYISGSLGIGSGWDSGTAATGEQLHIQALGEGNATMRLTSDGVNSDSIIKLRQSNDTGFDLIYDGGADKFQIKENGGNNPFQIEHGASTNTLYLDSSGNVGIGLSSPSEKLHIKGTTAATIVLNETTTGNAHFRAKTSNSNFSWFAHGNSNEFHLYDHNATSHPIKIEGGAPSSTLYLQNTGRIGLGTSSPESNLHVIGDLENSIPMMLIEGGTNIPEQDILILRDLGTAGGNTNNVKFQISPTGINIAQIQAISNGGTATSGGDLNLFTYSDGSGTVNTNQLYLKNDGRVGIGTSSPSSYFHVKGTARVEPDDGNNNYITFTSQTTNQTNLHYYSGGNSTWNIYSDDENYHIRRASSNPGTPSSKTFATFHSGNSTGGDGEGVEFTVPVTASFFKGDGSQLSNLSGQNFTGFVTTPGEDYVVTTNSAGNAIYGEGNLQFDGTDLKVDGNVAIGKGTAGIFSADSPLHIKHTGDSLGDSDLIHLSMNSTTTEGNISIKFSDANAVSTQHFKLTYGEGNEDLKFHSDSVDNILYLETGGQIGIGTNSPSSKLHVRDDSAAQIAYFRSDNAGTNSIRVERGSNTTIDLVAGATLYGGGLISSKELRFMVNGDGITSPTMTIDTNNKVGINNSTPRETLDVVGRITVDNSTSGTPAVTIFGDDDVANHPDIMFQSSALLAASGSMYMNIDADGNSTGAVFAINKNGNTDGATRVFTVNENGTIQLRDSAGTAMMSISSQINQSTNASNYDGVFVGETDLRIHKINFPGAYNDSGFISHESQPLANNAVLRLVPSDDVSGKDYVSIGGSSQVEGIRLFNSGEAHFRGGLAVGHLFNASGTSIAEVVAEGTIHVKTNADASLWLEADVDNAVSEGHNAYIKLTHDNSVTQFYLGTVGSADDNPEEAAATGTLANSLYIGSSTAHPIALVTNNVARLTVESGGNIGIINNNPDSQLQVGSTRSIRIGAGAGPNNPSTEGSISSQGSAAGGWSNYFKFLGSGGTDHGGFYGLGNTDSLTGWGIAPVYNSQYGLHVLSSGDGATSVAVGIGTTSPASILHVQEGSNSIKLLDTSLTDSDDAYLTIRGGTSSHKIAALNLKIDSTNLWQLLTDNADSNRFHIQYNDDAANRFLTVEPGGLVGIMNDNPAYALDVVGSVMSETSSTSGRFLLGGQVDAGIEMENNHVQIMAKGHVIAMIDSNGNETDRSFKVKTNSGVVDGGTERFRVQEDGNVYINNRMSFHSAASGYNISTVTDYDGIFESETSLARNQIYFPDHASSSDNGFIQHLTSGTSGLTNASVIRICPGDDENATDYVSIGGSDERELIRLFTTGEGHFRGGLAVGEVHDYSGTDVSGDKCSAGIIDIKSNGDAGIFLRADVDNIGSEGGNAFIEMTQDGTYVGGIIGLGQSATIGPKEDTIRNGTTNGMYMYSSDQFLDTAGNTAKLHLGAGSTMAMTVLDKLMDEDVGVIIGPETTHYKYGSDTYPALSIKMKTQATMTLSTTCTKVQVNSEHGGGLALIDNDSNKSAHIELFNGTDLLFGFRSDSTTSKVQVRGYIRHDVNLGAITFTGQHKNVPETGVADDYIHHVGKIVISKGTYKNLNLDQTSDKPNINEALPKVALSAQLNDKRVWGVISNAEDSSESSRTDGYGAFVSIYPKHDNRIIVNSVGEGAILVSNYNGDLENGDYITTCPLEGLGMKQDDDLLHNYTVAKITQDCDFTSDTTDVTHDGQTYKMKLVGCTYHCG